LDHVAPSLSDAQILTGTVIHVRDLGYFSVKDVDGDGNCFFNALVHSSYINLKCPTRLRNYVVDSLRGDSDVAQEARSLYDIVVKGTEFDSWLTELQTPGTWQGTTAALFICLLFEINVCIVSNSKNGFMVHDTKKWLLLRERNFIEDSHPTVYLYHHLHRRPFKKSLVCNHFAFMYRVDSSSIGNCEIYENEDSGLGKS
jgi:hypothetical protein